MVLANAQISIVLKRNIFLCLLKIHFDLPLNKILPFEEGGALLDLRLNTVIISDLRKTFEIVFATIISEKKVLIPVP